PSPPVSWDSDGRRYQPAAKLTAAARRKRSADFMRQVLVTVYYPVRQGRMTPAPVFRFLPCAGIREIRICLLRQSASIRPAQPNGDRRRGTDVDCNFLPRCVEGQGVGGSGIPIFALRRSRRPGDPDMLVDGVPHRAVWYDPADPE